MVLFSDFVISNPRIRLEKGQKYEFVEMANVSPGKKIVECKNKKIYNGGGSKFEDGDTLFARITPCLEHGKIAQFRSDEDMPAFGSTEFFVFRNIEGISDKNFLYYLCLSRDIRKAAEKSMSGASGRQRAKIEAIWEKDIFDPGVNNQQKIATILSNYDDLTENNKKRIKILENIAKSIYEEWFVRFKFPGHEKVKMIDSKTEFGIIPDGWEVGKLNGFLKELESGKRPKGGIVKIIGGIPSIGAENILGLGEYNFNKDKYVSKEFFKNMERGIVKEKDVFLYKDGAKLGRKSMFRSGFPHVTCCVNEHVFILRSKYQNYLYFWLDQDFMTKNIINLNSNSAQPGINQPGVYSLPILIPNKDVLKKFESLSDNILSLLFSLSIKNQNLRKTRDLLLPKLISGEIDVSELDIQLNQEVVNI